MEKDFVDTDRAIISKFNEIVRSYDGRNGKAVKKQLNQLIARDPNFLECYLFLSKIASDEGDTYEAEMMINYAFDIAINLICDDEGTWPASLKYNVEKNRHIIHTIQKKAISLWQKNEYYSALDLLRHLLRCDPEDGASTRFYMLALLMKINYPNFEEQFNKQGFHGVNLYQWFDENYKNYIKEFKLWESCVRNRE